MNSLLNIKLPFNHEKNSKKPGPRNLKRSNKVTINHLNELIDELNFVKRYYERNEKIIEGSLIDVYYNDVVPKSNRIVEVLKEKGECNDYIVGARFSEKENHIITYYIPMSALNNSIEKLEKGKAFLINELNGEANSENFDAGDSSINYSKDYYSRNKIRNIIIDCSVIERFAIPDAGELDDIKENVTITLYKTEVQFSYLINTLFKRNEYEGKYRVADENTIIVNPEFYETLRNKVPYLISMTAHDISKVSLNNSDIKRKREVFNIPSPKNEPVIGVIDTLFDGTVYFSDWVDYREEINKYEKENVLNKHYSHGTAVSSIIVDGPVLNSSLNDNLGRFRVRHFGVCTDAVSLTILIKKIERIVLENSDIHVWNISLGNEFEISDNFISFDGAALDKIQKENSVLFVVAGTNDDDINRKKLKKIGSPADSLNSLVVNSVKRDGTPASYTRNGKVLSFFNKPDVSYYGGDYQENERIRVYTNNGVEELYGSSLAAPWIARKLCYLIDVLGYPREVAKALIIDSAAGWEYKQDTYKYQNTIGYGIVPIKIEDVLNCDNSEIKFILQGNITSYMTSNYAIPVPKDSDSCPYIARATLCYFPQSNRLEGTDYTQRELTLKFGRIKDGKGILDINKNVIGTDGEYTDERRSRNEFRKWENTKFISSLLKDSNQKPLKLYGEGLWGVTLTSMERGRNIKHEDLLFGLVICLKNIKNENRIDDFKHACLLRGYIVNEVNIKNKIGVYEKAQNEIEFE